MLGCSQTGTNVSKKICSHCNDDSVSVSASLLKFPGTEQCHNVAIRTDAVCYGLDEELCKMAAVLFTSGFVASNMTDFSRLKCHMYTQLSKALNVCMQKASGLVYKAHTS